MIIYLIPAIILSFLAYLESNNNYLSFIQNKYLYLIVFSFFILFIGFRNEIGCDWDAYIRNFEMVYYEDWSNFLTPKNIKFFDIGYTIISKLISYKFDFKILVLFFSSLFTIPLFLFCYQLKNTYLSLLVSYPYFIVVIGMGPIRQAAAIGLVMLSIILASRNKYNLIYIITIISSFLHFSSIIFTSLAFLSIENLTKNKNNNNILKFIFLLGITFIIIYNFDWLYTKLFYQFKYHSVLTKAKSAIYVWIINFLPMMLYFTNINKFNFNKSLHKICSFFLVYEVLLFILILINNIIAYRFLLYCFPITIYIISYLPDLQILKIKSNLIVNTIILLSISSLIFWIKYANHSYCWLPYQNLIFN